MFWETLHAMLRVHEGLRLHVYDDATGEPVVPGYTLKGHPTIGYGLTLDIDGLTMDQVDELLRNRVRSLISQFQLNLPWADGVDDVRKAVLYDIAYNAGMRGLLEFRLMLAAVKTGEYGRAADEIRSSRLAPARREDLAIAMETGQWLSH